MRFHELNLPVGRTVDMLVVGQDYKKHTFRARLLGYQKNHFILVEPIDKPPQVYLRELQGVSLRIANDLGIARFDSQIERLDERPAGLLMELEYPVAIEFKQKRSWPRVRIDVPVQVVAHTGLGMKSGAIDGRLTDLSEVSAMILTQKALTKIVTQLDVTLSLSDGIISRNMNVLAVVSAVVDNTEKEPAYPFAYGIQFKDLDDIDRYFLRAYCLHQIAIGNILNAVE